MTHPTVTATGDLTTKQAVEGHERDLWDAYLADRSEAARNQLVLHHTPLVRYVVYRLNITPPDILDMQDLMAYGIFGLMDAISRFDPDRGVKFTSFAAERIRGAVIDELRAFEWMPRTLRSQVKEVLAVQRDFEQTEHRHATDSDIAAAMGADVAHVRKTRRLYAQAHTVALDPVADGSEHGRGWADRIADHEAGAALQNVENSLAHERMAAIVHSLPERIQVLVALYYYEGMTLKEVGEVLNVSTSRASQLHNEALALLRAGVTRD